MKSKPFGVTHGSLLPANIAHRTWNQLKSKFSPEKHPQVVIIPMYLETGGWHEDTSTDRIFSRFITAEQCGLIVTIGADGFAEEAHWVLATGEELYGEQVITSIPFKDVETSRLSDSIDINIRDPIRLAFTGTSAVSAWLLAAEHLPIAGEVILISSIGAVFLLEKRIRLGIKWDENNYAVGSIIETGYSLIDAIDNGEPLFPQKEILHEAAQT